MTQSIPSLPENTLLDSESESTELPQNKMLAGTSPNQSASSIIVRAPRSPWWEFFLHFSTCGVYTNFWLVARVKEIRQLSNQSLKPWYWFFVPNFVLVQPFALPKLNRILLQVEKDNNIHYPENHFKLWATVVIALSAFFWANTNYAMPSWLTLVGLLLWSGIFCALSQRLNTVKQKLVNVEFKGKPSGYAFWEWLVVIPFFPITLIVLIYISVSPYMVNEISPISDQTVYTAPNGQFQLTIHGEGWREVEIGSFSDGTADLELAGAVEDSSFLVFKASKLTSLNAMVQNRIDYIQSELPNSQCREERTLAQSKLSVISYVVCEGKNMHGPQLSTVTVFKNGDNFYELFGNLNAPKRSYPERSAEFKQMAKEFQPL
jgi:hypothetical protein